MKDKKGREKRKHRRKETLVPITVRITRIEDQKQNFYFTKDLSLGGVFLKTENELPVGTIMELELAIHGVDQLIRVKGKVARVSRVEGSVEGMGIEFIEIEEESSRGLKTYLGEN